MTAGILAAPRTCNGVFTDGTAAAAQTREYLNSVLRGKPEVVEQVLICLLAQGHLLIEDKPGLGKTTLAKALAYAVGGRFARVQCTPDLLPGDITGFSIYNQKAHEFEFRPGPVFSEVLLADEINRATPRTQSALLEAMAERQVTVDAVRYPLSPDFFVIATQNPIDQHGTFPLPEAQLDRFTMKLSIGYPSPQDELQMLRDATEGNREQARPEPLFPEKCLVEVQQQVARLPIAEPLQEYLVRLADASRRHPQASLGVSPRGLLTWQRAAQARAFLNQRTYVTPDDVQDTAIPVLCVRLGVDRGDPVPVIREILDSVPVPEYRVPARPWADNGK
ncbi:MAG: MoxR family ATPase [Planctomycetes bacterium]|nr:MoxR family ATPase [Planctomycetota bacterium]